MPTGMFVYQTVENVRPRSLLAVTSNSGGTTLLSGGTAAMTVKNLTGNGDMFVGGSASGNVPYSGYGFLLAAGEAVSLTIDNFNKVNVFATVSGDVVSYFGIV